MHQKSCVFQMNWTKLETCFPLTHVMEHPDNFKLMRAIASLHSWTTNSGTCLLMQQFSLLTLVTARAISFMTWEHHPKVNVA